MRLPILLAFTVTFLLSSSAAQTRVAGIEGTGGTIYLNAGYLNAGSLNVAGDDDGGPAQAQKQAAEVDPGLEAILQARRQLRAAEASHPGNTPEVTAALENLIGLILDARLTNAETLALARRHVLVAEGAYNRRSKQYVAAIDELAEVLVALDRPAEARTHAEQALSIASIRFPNTTEYGDAADVVALVCRALGDFPCALRAERIAVDTARKVDQDNPFQIVGALSNLSQTLNASGDKSGALAPLEEAVTLANAKIPNDPRIAVIENNLGFQYYQTGNFDQAIVHLTRALELNRKLYGENSPLVTDTRANLGQFYGRSGKFELSFKTYDETLAHMKTSGTDAANTHSNYGRSLASGGRLLPAIQQGLIGARLGRETFVLGARTLPERQALAYDRIRAHGVDVAISVLAKHPELPLAETYQEVIRSRALVAEEMARRQTNLNRTHDPELTQLLKELDRTRTALLELEQSQPSPVATPEAIARATEEMERAEAAVAQKSSAFRHDERIRTVLLDDLRRNMPKDSVLISFVRFGRSKVEEVDPTGVKIYSYVAFVLHPDTGKLRIFDLGPAQDIDSLIESARRTVDTEIHSGGMGGKRNERAYREAAGSLREKVWDPLIPEFKGARLLLIVPDGELNLIPFAALPDEDGYWLDHGPVIHTLSSERDLLPDDRAARKSGLVAIGNPAFNRPLTIAANQPSPTELPPDTTRSATLSCDEFKQVRFHPLPASALEVKDISAQWQAANGGSPAESLLGDEATRDGFLREAVRGRVLHVATHAFLLSQSCGDGNPLLHSGLVFAGANSQRESSLLTAQQIASLDLDGVDWAVLSACNTGTGELRDGEGVLGLQRAFRVAGARSVIMTLWPVDDNMSRRYMHQLYTERFGHKATTADSVWNASRKLLADRRAAGKSTHPWYWAGFVGSGSWE